MSASLQQLRAELPSLQGLNDAQAVSYLRQRYAPDVGEDVIAKNLGITLPAPAAAAQPSRGLLRGIGDTALAFGQGAVSGVRMLTDVAGADNAASTGLRSVADYLGSLKSAQAKQDEQEIARILQEAEGAGVLDQVMAGMRAFATAPVATTAQALGSAVPTIGAALIPGVGTAALAGRAGMLAGRFAPAAVGAAQGVGSVKGSIFDATKQAYMAEDLSEEEATAKAAQAQAYSSANAGQIALGGALGAVAGGSGLESAARAMRVGATGAAPGLLRRVGTGALVEAAPEAAQGGQEKFAANTALANEGFDVNPWAGVVAAGTMEGIAGGLLGGAFGVPKPREASPTPVEAAKKVLEAPTLDAALDAAAQAVSTTPPSQGTTPGQGSVRAELAQMDPEDRQEVLGLLQVVQRPGVSANVRAFAEQRLETIRKAYREIPAGEAVEELPTGDARELTDAERLEYVNAVPFTYRLAMQRGLPQPDVSEVIPAPDATEIEPIPVGDAFEEIPTPDAAEVLPVGDATEAIPTGDALDLTDPIPAPDVAEADVETIQADDLLTGDGVPYGSLTAARVRAKREGLPLENVVEIPGAGWVIRPSGPARASATVGGAPMQARPAGTRGTNAGDVIRAPAVTVGNDSERQGAVAAAPAPQAQPQGRAPEAAAPADSLRAELQEVERQILAAAPGRFSKGGGDIEAAAKRKEVPAALKERRKALKAQIRAADAAPKPAPEPAAEAPQLETVTSEPKTLKERAEAMAAKGQPVHQDPGEAPEVATKAVVTEAVRTAAGNRDRKPSEMRAELLRMIDQAIARAPDEAELDAQISVGQAVTRMGAKEFSGSRRFDDGASVTLEARQDRDGSWTVADTSYDGSGTGKRRYKKMGKLTGSPSVARDQLSAMLRTVNADGSVREPDTVTLKVPGDGTFRILNTKQRLEKFRAQVESSPGFKDRQAPLQSERVSSSITNRTKEPNTPFGVERGSGGPKAVIENMVDDGDPQAAVDYAAARGLDVAEVLKGDKARLGKVAGLTPTAEAVGEFEPETEPAAPAQPAAASAAPPAQQAEPSAPAPAAEPATPREAPNDQPREPAAQAVGQVSGAEGQEGAGEVAPRTAKRSPDQAQTIELRKRLKVLEALRRCVG